MDNGALIFGIGILVVLLAVYSSIRWVGLTAKAAGIIMSLTPILLMTVIYFVQGGDVLQVICSPLLSLIFGPATYAVGRVIERKVNEDQNTQGDDMEVK